MPNYDAHIDIAREAASRLRNHSIEANMGSYLLGSTSPDVRIITRKTREDYHFAPLNSEDVSAGVKGFFRHQPHLADAARLPAPTRAFVAGYISHLIADQMWIISMYRPFFGNRDVFEDHRLGNVMDRALQLELDRRARDTLNNMQEIKSLLADADQGVELGFISGETLAQWREWVLAALDRGFTWERLRPLACRRLLPEDHESASVLAEEFLESVSQGMARLYERVPVEEVDHFREKSIQEFIGVVEAYLQ